MKTNYITIGSVLGILYLIWSVYHKFRIGFDQNELAALITDLIIVLPAIVGIVFYSGKKLVPKIIKTVYWIYLALQVLIFILILTSKDAIGFGIPMLLIVLPVATILSIILLVKLTSRSGN